MVTKIRKNRRMAKFRLKELVLKVFGPLGGCGWSGNGCLFREAVG